MTGRLEANQGVAGSDREIRVVEEHDPDAAGDAVDAGTGKRKDLRVPMLETRSREASVGSPLACGRENRARQIQSEHRAADPTRSATSSSATAPFPQPMSSTGSPG